MKKRNHKIFAMLLSGMTAMTLMTGTGVTSVLAETENTAEEEAVEVEEAETVEEESAEESEADTAEEEESEELTQPDRPEYQALDYVTLGEYTNLTIDEPEVSVTEEEIAESMLQWVSSDSYEELTEGTVETGDIANINYVGTMDGEVFDGGSADNYDLTIGSGSFIDGFEDGLIGVAIGETVDLELTFPETYYEEMAGKAVTFAVTVNSVKRMPEWSDELVAEITEEEYSDLDSFRAYVEEELLESKEAARLSNIKSSLLNQVLENSEITEYPEELIQYGLTNYRNYCTMYAQYYGMTFEDFVPAVFGVEAEEFDETVRGEIEESYQEELLLGAIAETEGVELTDKEFEEKALELGKTYGFEDLEEFLSAYNEKEIRVVVRNNMVYDYLMENAAK